MYRGFDIRLNKAVVGALYKKDGQFFIITEERDCRGFKISYEVDPKTIEYFNE